MQSIGREDRSSFPYPATIRLQITRVQTELKVLLRAAGANIKDANALFENSMADPSNVTRLLDARGIKYSVYELPADKLGAAETARLLKVKVEQVYKTIVINLEKPKRPLLVLVPGDAVVDLKLLAASLGEKKVFLPTEREAEDITGLQAGGISPLALIHKGFQVIMDTSAQNHDAIHVSGGRRGLNIRLAVVDLAELTHARFLAVSRPDVTDNRGDG